MFRCLKFLARAHAVAAIVEEFAGKESVRVRGERSLGVGHARRASDGPGPRYPETVDA